MPDVTITIKKKSVQRKLNEIAKQRFNGNAQRAGEKLLEDKIESEMKGIQKGERKRLDLTKYKFVGMWADREDMKDSVAWVSKIRKQEEQRHLR